LTLRTLLAIFGIVGDGERRFDRRRHGPMLRRKLSSAPPGDVLRVPALVVGGGPVGLYASALLSAFGVPSVLAERAPFAKTKQHPRSHYINSRSMELLRELGVEDAVRRQTPPLSEWRHFRYCTSLLGTQIAAQDHAGDAAWSELCAAAATEVAHLSQPKLEAILRAEAERRAPAAGGRLLDGYECAHFEQDAHGVIAQLRPVSDGGGGGGGAASGDVIHVHAEQLLACDGAHSRIRTGTATASRTLVLCRCATPWSFAAAPLTGRRSNPRVDSSRPQAARAAATPTLQIRPLRVPRARPAAARGGSRGDAPFLLLPWGHRGPGRA